MQALSSCGPYCIDYFRIHHMYPLFCKSYRYTAGIFFPTARAVISDIEVTWHLTLKLFPAKISLHVVLQNLWCQKVTVRVDRQPPFKSIRSFSKDDGDSTENVTFKMNSRFFQFAKNVKCRRISVQLISWGPHLRLDRERKIRRRLFMSSIKSAD